MNAPEELRCKVAAAEEQIKNTLSDLRRYLGSGYIVILNTECVTRRTSGHPVEQVFTKCKIDVTYVGDGE